ncbi:MAG: DUF3299 domain-containing protein [Alphaproteobacteria bacterium]|nr:DUF3299 domain-containing protein [Alphaproteobacteria bacterium]
MRIHRLFGFALTAAVVIVLAAIAAALAVSPGASAANARTLKWDELLPPGWTAPLDKGVIEDPNAPSGIGYDPKFFPVNAALNGKKVRVPGYVVPLDMGGDTTEEFLLVSYLGACIHVPPPPPNQMIYVKTEKPVKFDGLFMAVWTTGTILTQHKDSELGLAGYSMTADAVEPYKGPDLPIEFNKNE